MPHRTTAVPDHKTPAVCRYWLVATGTIASAAAIFAAAGHGDHPVSWVLRIATAVAAVGWLIRAAEARLSGEMDTAVTRAWWMGYATCLEDQGEQAGKVVQLRRASSDKIGDTGRRLNSTERR